MFGYALQERLLATFFWKVTLTPPLLKNDTPASNSILPTAKRENNHFCLGMGAAEFGIFFGSVESSRALDSYGSVCHSDGVTTATS